MLAHVRAAAAASSSRWHARLTSRGVLVVEGADARKLIQGLVTSDVSLLDKTGPQYTTFLSAQGRVLHDAFLVSGAEGSVLIDAELDAVPALTKHLKRYKLRSKVQVREASEEMEVLAICGGDGAAPEAGRDGFGGGAPSEGGEWADPRLPCLGRRVEQRLMQLGLSHRCE